MQSFAFDDKEHRLYMVQVFAKAAGNRADDRGHGGVRLQPRAAGATTAAPATKTAMTSTT